MTRVQEWGVALAAVCVALPAAGCGAKPVPVKGVVRFDDKPLAHAAVMFIPLDPGGREATGYTDAQGAFELTTFRLKDGALPGTYKVTVQYSEPVELPPNLKTPEEVQKAMVQAGASGKPSVVIPSRYSRADETVLKHKVPQDGDAKLELRSTP